MSPIFEAPTARGAAAERESSGGSAAKSGELSRWAGERGSCCSDGSWQGRMSHAPLCLSSGDSEAPSSDPSCWPAHASPSW